MNDAAARAQRPIGLLGRWLAAYRRAFDLGVRAARVALVLVVVAALGAAFFGYRARAQLGELLLSIGAQLMRYPDARRQDAPRTLVLNGQRLRFASGTADHDLSRVLDHYEARCAERAGHFAEQLRALRGTVQAPPGDGDFFDGVLRMQTAHRGFVACLDMGPDSVPPEGVFERFDRLMRTADLANLGQLRYVYAERSAEGRTHFLVFWSEGEFRIVDLFPDDGDAPGSDPATVPRLPGTRRLLSFHEQDHPQHLALYEIPGRNAETTRAELRTRMQRDGWRLVDGNRSGAEGNAPPAMVFERDQSMVTLVVTPSGRGSTLTVLVSR
ncbi:MAG: hypothetical protein NZ898_13645 [Myxococcota bacterium]|nr:hypothetical protein [Myxococcota bacterium]MDW8361067.1 hypothetical protein [Myxococcales bacterium]